MTALGFGPDRVEAIARKLFGEPNRRLSTKRELRFGRQGSLSVVLDRGVFHDHEAGVTGGVFDMMIHAGAGKDRREAARLLREDGDLPPRETPEDRQAREEAAARSRAARMAVAARVWREGVAITDTPAETYLRRARVIAAPLHQAALRFSPAVPLQPYASDGKNPEICASVAQNPVAPALLARVVDGSGAPIGAHITYLQPDGAGKARVAIQRKMVGIVGGGHVRLIPGPSLVVGEGLESTFSAWEQAAAERGPEGLGASAALSAGEVARFVWPADTRELIISPDRDEKGAGERGARELGRRAHAAGLEVNLLWPPEGFSDWNAVRLGVAK